MTMRAHALVMSAMLGACATRPAPQPLTIANGSEDEVVVSRLALARVVDAIPEPTVVLESTTTLGLLVSTSDEIAASLRATKVDLPDPLVTDFLAANRRATQLSGASNGRKRIVLVTAQEGRALLGGGDGETGWARFRRTFPRTAGIFKLSRAAFHRDLALVHVELHCGIECGRGHLILLRKSQGRWTVVATATTWLS